jgi:succinate dehydrogenase / fumarate reductase membrane anchor subunit
MRTPLGRVRGLGSAKHGGLHWWHERVRTAALVPLSIFFVWLVLSLAGADHATTVATLANPLVMALLLLFVVIGIEHMKAGMQVVIEDYIHTDGTKLILLGLNAFFSYGLAAAGVVAILKIGFGM